MTEVSSEKERNGFMSETNIAEPRQNDENSLISSDSNTTPKSKEQLLIPVKYNKETRMLTVEEASKLAQLGLKFEAVSKNFDTLKSLAKSENKSVSAFLEDLQTAKTDRRRNILLEKCGGDKDLAEHILSLEGDGNTRADGFEELQEFFPNFKTRSDLPEQVTESANMNGTLLLDEYLRFCLRERHRIKEAARLQKSAEISSTGSQINRSGYVDPETAEFLKGLWKR